MRNLCLQAASMICNGCLLLWKACNGLRFRNNFLFYTCMLENGILSLFAIKSWWYLPIRGVSSVRVVIEFVCFVIIKEYELLRVIWCLLDVFYYSSIFFALAIICDDLASLLSVVYRLMWCNLSIQNNVDLCPFYLLFFTHFRWTLLLSPWWE